MFFYEALRVERKENALSIAVAITLQNIAQIHHSIGNLQKAIDVFEETLTIIIENLGINCQVVASLLNALGNLYLESGKISESVLAYIKSQRIEKIIKTTGGAIEDELNLKLLLLFGYNNEAQAPAAAAA